MQKHIAIAGGGLAGSFLAATLLHEPDVLFLDVEMPGVSGYETCRRMRRTAGEEVPIVMVTGMDDAAFQEAFDTAKRTCPVSQALGAIEIEAEGIGILRNGITDEV